MDARAALEHFLPNPDVRDRHETVVHAPAEFVMDVARHFDIQSLPLVRAIFSVRATVMGSKSVPLAALSLESLQQMGWGVLDEQKGRHFVAGAICQPWLADVRFTPLPAEEFVRFAGPDRVKIVWTLEAEPVGQGDSRFATETRAAATDAASREKFRRYWRLARYGIVLIRLLLVPAIRRQAERRWRPEQGT